MIAILVLGRSGCTPLERPSRFPSVEGFALDLEGHRGARGLLPENTIEGFRRAIELGVSTLELDVVISADSQVVVSHEPWFSEVICSTPDGIPVPAGAGSDLRIFEMDYDEIERYDCGRRGHPDFPDQQPMDASKPLLRQVIEDAEAYAAALGRSPPWYNVETKSKAGDDFELHPEPAEFVRLVLDVIARTGIEERAIIQSFDWRTLRVARQSGSRVLLSMLVSEDADQGVAINVERLGFVPEIYSPAQELVDAHVVRSAHQLGMRVVPWTVNDAARIQVLIDAGVDGLITDYPDQGMAVLRSAEVSIH